RISLLNCLALFLITAGEVSGNNFINPQTEGLENSRLFEVNINNQNIWIERYVSNLDVDQLPDWFNATYVREPQEQHIASFTGTGRMDVKVRVKGQVNNVTIRPASRNITPVIEGNLIRFNWSGPGQLIVEADDLPPLYLFADPEEINKP